MVRHEIGKIFRPSLHQVRHGGQTTKNLAWHRRPLGRQFEQSGPFVSFNLLSYSYLLEELTLIGHPTTGPSPRQKGDLVRHTKRSEKTGRKIVQRGLSFPS